MEYSIGDILEMKSGRQATVTMVDANDPGCPIQVRCSDNDYSFWADAETIEKVLSRGDTQLDRIESKLDKLLRHLGIAE